MIGIRSVDHTVYLLAVKLLFQHNYIIMTVELYSQDSIFNAGLTSVQAITQLIEPVYDTDLATKYYVDHAINILETDPRFDPNIVPLTEIPLATDSVVGGIKIGHGLTISLDGTLATILPEMLPLSGGTVTGQVSILSAITFPNGQVFRSTSAPVLTSLPVATNTTAGIVIKGEGLTIDNNGTISVIPFNGLHISGGNVYGDVTVYGVLSAADLRGTINNFPTANEIEFGCVKIGANLYLDDQNKLNAFAPYILTSATREVLGGVIIGNGIFVENGVISTSSVPATGGLVDGDLYISGSLHANNIVGPSNYTLPKATTNVLGGIRVGANLTIDSNGVLNANSPFTLTTATSSELGGVRVGDTLAIDASGYLTTKAATSSTFGSIKIGNDLKINNEGVVNLTNTFLNITGGTITHNLSVVGEIFATTIHGTLTSLPIATVEHIGGIKVGDGLIVDETGKLSLDVNTEGGMIDLTGIVNLSSYIPLSGNCNLTGTISGNDSAKLLFENTALSSVTTFAGSMLNQMGNLNGFQVNASFARPSQMTKDLSGNIFVADTLNHSIRKITPQGQVTTIAGGTGAGLVNGVGTLAKFSTPVGIVIDSTENLYVSDAGNSLIRKLTKNINDTYTVSTLAGNILKGVQDGTGSGAKFQYPSGMTIDTNDNIFVIDLKSISGSTTNGNVIRKVTTGGVVTTVVGGGADLSPNTTAANCRLAWNTNTSSKLTIDSQNNLIYADLYRVLKITPSGTVTTIAGGNTYSGGTIPHTAPYIHREGYITDNGDGYVGSLPLIFSVFVDKSENDTLYVGSSNYLKQITKTTSPNIYYFKNIIANGTYASDTFLNEVRAGTITCVIKDVNNDITYLDSAFNKICKIVPSRCSFDVQGGIITPLLRAGKIYGDGSGLANVFLRTGGILDGPLYSTNESTFGKLNIIDGSTPMIVAEINQTTGLGDITITGTYNGDGGGLTNVLHTSGGVIQGNLTLTGKLSSKGDIITDGDIVAFASSDRNLKENIYNIPNSLEKVLQLNGVCFNWKENNTAKDIGVIAQEVEQVLPEIVTTRANGYKAVQYDKLIPLLIESIKDLKNQIDDLKTQLKGR